MDVDCYSFVNQGAQRPRSVDWPVTDCLLFTISPFALLRCLRHTARLHFPSSFGFGTALWPGSGQWHVSEVLCASPGQGLNEHVGALHAFFSPFCSLGEQAAVRPWGIAQLPDGKSWNPESPHGGDLPTDWGTLRRLFCEWDVGSVWCEGSCTRGSFGYLSLAYPN